MPSRSSIERNRQTNLELSRLVKAELTAFFDTLNLSDPEASRDALLDYVPALVAQYGNLAEQMALEWYAEMVEEDGGSYSPEAPEPFDLTEQVTASVRFAAGKLWSPRPREALGPLSIATDKHVRQPGRDALQWNARSEGATWARVPTGATTCSFCLVLASRDAVYVSEKSAGSRDYGEENEFHGDDDCEIVRVAPGEEYPEGYLPDDFYKMYEAARHSADSGDLKDILAAFRREFPDVVTDGVHTP